MTVGMETWTSLALMTVGSGFLPGESVQSPSRDVASAPDSTPRLTQPVLAFPEPRLDDTAAYQGYQTRFYRDLKGNTVQIYLQPNGGRAVLVWADAANESAGFTARDAAGRAAALVGGGGPGGRSRVGSRAGRHHRFGLNSHHRVPADRSNLVDPARLVCPGLDAGGTRLRLFQAASAAIQRTGVSRGGGVAAGCCAQTAACR